MNSYKKFFAVSALTLAMAGCNQMAASNSKSSSVQPTQKAASLQLNIEKYQLPNGLDVVLHQDKSDPVVAIAIQYHVGSNREKPGRTGFAHFFEHMLFQDSKHVGPGNFIKNIGNMGGTLNGGTWQDGTIYYEAFPSDGLEKVLWMESDRMGYFINTLTQAGLENEKQVVKNEKRQGVDNRPYGHTDSVLLKTLYPEGHPYSWDVIGSLADLQNATLEDVREFYDQWYGVNNATLVLAGDFESDQAKAWINKYFSEFKPRGNVDPLPPMPVSISKSKSLYHEDNFAKLPELTLTYPTIEKYQKDAYALQLLADLLSDGKDSALYQILVEQDKLAPSVEASSSNSEIAGVFQIRIRAFNDIKLDKVRQSIEQALALFAKDGFSDQQLARIISGRETAFYNSLNSVFNKASELAQANEFSGDPGLVATEIERFRAVTRADIMSVFKRYLQGQNTIATSFVPKGKADLALSGAVKADVDEEKIVQGSEQQMAATDTSTTLAPAVELKSSFDRYVVPPYGEQPQINLPAIWQTSLASGVKVLGIAHNELPLVSFSIRVMGGHSLDKVGQSGVANLLTKIMMEGTATKTPQQFEDALGILGAELNFSADDEYITLTGSTLATHFDEVVALAQEVILQPRWDQTQWQRIKQQTVARIQQASANPGAIAANVYAKLMYGDNSMMAQPVTGTEAQVNSITLEDVKAFYRDNLVANLASIHVAGQITQQQVVKSLKPLATQWKQGQVTLPKPTMAQPIEQAKVYFVDVPGAKQSFIRIGSRAMTADSSDYYPTVAVNHNLGGSFSGQLFQILRLQKGYTYGAYSGVSQANAGGVFTAQSSVRSNVTLESLQTFRDIMSDYGKNFDQSALDNTKSVLAKANALAFETTGDLMGVLQDISSYRLADNYVEEYQKVLSELTLPQASKAISQYMNPDKMIYLVVGDAQTQLGRIKELGLGEPVLLDHSGQPVM
ncbi:MAG: zinc protease [Phenylobacterium sp.]|jgi:zinc protease